MNSDCCQSYLACAEYESLKALVSRSPYMRGNNGNISALFRFGVMRDQPTKRLISLSKKSTTVTAAVAVDLGQLPATAAAAVGNARRNCHAQQRARFAKP